MITGKSISCAYSVLLIVMILIGGAALPASVRAASNITVNSLTDTIAVDGNCALREAIQNANNNASTNSDCIAGNGSDTITFSLSGTISLSTILPTITDTAGLALDGTGQAVTISGNNASMVVVVSPGASLTLNHMTIANGYTNSHGGAIINSGTMVILNSDFSENNAYYFGGGIINSGALTITNSIFTGNTANKGGGIYNDAGGLTITNSTFFNNSASGGEGGAINVFFGSLNITDSTFNQNSASLGRGGGIYNAVGTMTITNSTFSENTANDGEGGAIFNNYSLTIKSSAITGNGAGSGGGIYNSGAYLTVANSTFFGNIVSNTGVNGGGILNEDHGVVVNSTFSGNSAPDSGGAIGTTNSHLTLRNTIVANSVSGGNCTGQIANGGNNLDDGATCGWGSAFDSMSDIDPDLGTLTGSPAYFPLDAGSPAIDTGDNAICATAPVNNESQNGITRPQGGTCEIGSYEFPILAASLSSIGANDGWILETTETSTTGGTMNNTATTLWLGDDASDRQYRAILHFDTSSLPDTAVITSATLQLRKQSTSGTNPFTILGSLRVDARRPDFGLHTLELTDFKASAAKNNIATFDPTPAGSWYSAVFNSAGRLYINRTGTTQFKIYFTIGDNDDLGADLIKFYSGNARASLRPKLVIQYYIP